ncbi:hypothetical protein EV143_1051, partial [Flavobacterium chryseum]
LKTFESRYFKMYPLGIVNFSRTIYESVFNSKVFVRVTTYKSANYNQLFIKVKRAYECRFLFF